jgi:hypothetical protein
LKAAKLGNSKIQRWIIQMSQVPHQIIASHSKNRGNGITVSDTLSRPAFTKVITDKRFTNKMSFKIRCPFPIGRVLTVQDIDNALEQDPDLVEITPIKLINRISVPLTLELKPLLTTENFIKEQRRDKEIQKRSNDIQEKGDKSVFAKTYRIHQGLLYKTFKKTETQDQETLPGRLYIPKSLEGPLMAFYHVNNHQGAQGLYRQLASSYLILCLTFSPNSAYSVEWR